MANDKHAKTEVIHFRIPAAAKQALVDFSAGVGMPVGSLLRMLFEQCDSWPEDARRAVAARFAAAGGLMLVGASPCVTERPRQLVYRRSPDEQRRLAIELIDAMWPEPSDIDGPSAVAPSGTDGKTNG